MKRAVRGARPGASVRSSGFCSRRSFSSATLRARVQADASSTANGVGPILVMRPWICSSSSARSPSSSSTRCMRPRNSSAAAEELSSGTLTSSSPTSLRGMREVASTRSCGAASSRASTQPAWSATPSSSSKTSSVGSGMSWAATSATLSHPSRPRRSAMSPGTSAASRTARRSIQCVPPGASGASSCANCAARRVLPIPPGPTNTPRRAARSVPKVVFIHCPRPRSGESHCGRSMSWADARSALARRCTRSALALASCSALTAPSALSSRTRRSTSRTTRAGSPPLACVNASRVGALTAVPTAAESHSPTCFTPSGASVTVLPGWKAPGAPSSTTSTTFAPPRLSLLERSIRLPASSQRPPSTRTTSPWAAASLASLSRTSSSVGSGGSSSPYGCARALR